MVLSFVDANRLITSFVVLNPIRKILECLLRICALVVRALELEQHVGPDEIVVVANVLDEEDVDRGSSPLANVIQDHFSSLDGGICSIKDTDTTIVSHEVIEKLGESLHRNLVAEFGSFGVVWVKEFGRLVDGRLWRGMRVLLILESLCGGVNKITTARLNSSITLDHRSVDGGLATGSCATALPNVEDGGWEDHVEISGQLLGGVTLAPSGQANHDDDELCAQVDVFHTTIMMSFRRYLCEWQVSRRSQGFEAWGSWQNVCDRSRH